MRDYGWYKHPDRSKLSPPSLLPPVPTWRQIGIRALLLTAGCTAVVALFLLLVRR